MAISHLRREVWRVEAAKLLASYAALCSGGLPLLLGDALARGGRRNLLANAQSSHGPRALLSGQTRVCSCGVDQRLPVGKLGGVGRGSSAAADRSRGCPWTLAGGLVLGCLTEGGGQCCAAWAGI
jgi:hypothetical protein